MPGPLPAFLLPITVPLSWVYGLAIAQRNRRFDRGVGAETLPVPVVSVGNLTTGGAGKTPMVAWMADLLVAAGHRPLVAMRGYGARAGETSDEEAEYASRIPRVPVVADPCRADAVRRYLAAHPDDRVDGVLLDDGFQHRRIRRDLDVVLIDAGSAALTDRLLPAGHLREPPSSLRRADAVVITHAESPDEALAGRVQRHAGRPPVAWTRHRWTGLTVHTADGAPTREVDWLGGRRVATMLGVARPEGVRRQVERAGATIVIDVPVRDHERYDPARVAAVGPMCDGLDALLCTGKDWVKLRELVDLRRWPCPVVVPDLRLEFLAGEAELSEQIRRVFAP
ncbi:MAG: tetraacyldisaccharide 4'-kinase [Planctomycetota bacterium]|jgi:tetraacyldisaccharide 4'-kinase